MNKVYKVLLGSVFVSLLFLAVPFHISANGSLSAPFVGYNVYEIQHDTEYSQYSDRTVEIDLSGLRLNCSSYNSSGACSLWLQPSSYEVTGNADIILSGSGLTYSSLYQVDLILDNDYIGRVTLLINADGSNYTRTYYVNGNKISFTWSSSTTISVSSYNLTLRESEEDVEYLMWDYPIESYNFVSYWIGLGKLPVELFQDSYYTYPVFELNTNEQIWRSSLASGESQIVIFGIDKYITASNFDSYFTVPAGFSVQYENIGLIPLSSSTYGRIVKYTFTNNNSSSASVILNYIGGNTRIIPIYSRNSKEKLLSTDFALQFGMSNSLLDNIQIIANGTSASAGSVNDLAQQTDDLQTQSNALIGQEDDFRTDMNSALNDIDTNFTFGSKFLSSAEWVRTQYNRLVLNTPFESLITFSLLLGLALIMIGKVFK